MKVDEKDALISKIETVALKRLEKSVNDDEPDIISNWLYVVDNIQKMK